MGLRGANQQQEDSAAVELRLGKGARPGHGNGQRSTLPIALPVEHQSEWPPELLQQGTSPAAQHHVTEFRVVLMKMGRLA